MTLLMATALSCVPGLVLAAPDRSSGNDVAPPSISIEPIADGTIGKAGAALHDVAKLQQKYQVQMDSASPDQKKRLSAQANAEALQAIQSRGLSLQEYSNVVRTAQNNPQVK
jgi:hypothetical protein